MLRLVRKVLEDRSGPTAIEYGLIAGLIAIVTIAGITQLGTTLNTWYNGTATTIQGAG